MGTVNKVSSSHIGCLVHGCFNASIPKPEQMPADQWQTLQINVGDELEFEVFRLDSDAAGVFCIRGKLSIASLQTKCSAVPEEAPETGADEPVEKPPKKKKKRRKTESHVKWKAVPQSRKTLQKLPRRTRQTCTSVTV